MKREIQPKTAARWYAPDQKAFDRLEALGAPERHIYCGWKGQVIGKFKMRPGEYLGVVDGYRAFGTGRRAITKAVDLIHADGATVLDIETGRDSRNHGHILMPEAISGRHISAEHRRRMADEAAEARRVKAGGMTNHEIQTVWKRPGIPSADERAEFIGIPRSTLYAKWGRSGALPGRRPKHLLET